MQLTADRLRGRLAERFAMDWAVGSARSGPRCSFKSARWLVASLLQSYGAYMPKADSGTDVVLVTGAPGAAIAVLRRPDSFAYSGYASRIPRPKPPSRVSAIAATALVAQALQSTGHPSVLSTLKQFTPAAGAAVALIAFVGTTIQYLRDRKRERGLRVEEGIAESTNRLTAFPSNSDAGIGSVVAALRNLRGFVARSADPARIETEVAEILVTVTREDLDYRDPRHARFDILCLQN